MSDQGAGCCVPCVLVATTFRGGGRVAEIAPLGSAPAGVHSCCSRHTSTTYSLAALPLAARLPAAGVEETEWAL